jgi:purine-binding chemotaxis protein CheW
MNGDVTGAGSEEIPSARTSMGVADGERASWLLCRAASVICALPIGQVMEIMRPLAIEEIAGAPACVRGLSIIRGTPMPVVDFGLIIGDCVTRATRVVTIKAEERPVALAVEDVLGITTIAAEALCRLPPLLRAAATDAIAAIGALDTELIVFLRTARLVPDDVMARLNAEDTAT